MLLPNVLNDDVGVFKSISPIIGYYRREDSRDDIISRIIIFIILVLCALSCFVFYDYFIYIIDLFSYVSVYVKDWGFNKLYDYHNSSSGNSLTYRNKYDTYMKNIGDI